VEVKRVVKEEMIRLVRNFRILTPSTQVGGEREWKRGKNEGGNGYVQPHTKGCV